MLSSSIIRNFAFDLVAAGIVAVILLLFGCFGTYGLYNDIELMMWQRATYD